MLTHEYPWTERRKCDSERKREEQTSNVKGFVYCTFPLITPDFLLLKPLRIGFVISSSTCRSLNYSSSTFTTKVDVNKTYCMLKYDFLHGQLLTDLGLHKNRFIVICQIFIYHMILILKPLACSQSGTKKTVLVLMDIFAL